MTLRRVAVLVVVLGILGSAARARAEDVADEAQFHFARGAQLYRQGRFEDALSEFYVSNRLVANRNVQFNIARCLEQLKLYDEAFRAWSEMERKEAPPAERTTIAAAIEKLRPHLALVRVTSEPPGAEIFANRRDLGSLGTTPRLLALPAGKLTILLDRPGYRSAEVAVELVKGKELPVVQTLERIYGTVVFRGLPLQASIREGAADGPVVPVGPTPTRLVPGRHVLFISAPGFQLARIEIDVPPDASTSVDVPLAAATGPTGAVVVRANVDGALVRVDGREMGFTPAVIEGVPVGDREIEVAHEGRDSFRTHVTVEKGRRSFLDVHLKRVQPQVEAATKRLTRAEDAPASITILTAEQIRAHGWLTVSEALRSVRGVVSSNDRTYEAVGFRGLSPPGDYTRRVLVLVDGHPYNDIVTGGSYVGHDLDVDLDTVERIEVVRGPGSVLYGTGALFGVINVVTRRPAPGAHGEAAGKLGTLGTTSGRVSAGVRGENSELWVSGAGYDSAGQLLFPWSTAAGPVAVGADGETAKHGDLLGRAGPFTLRAAVNDRTKMVPTGVYGTQPAPGTTYRDLRAFAELRFDQPLKRVNLSARFSYDYGLFQGHYLQVMPPDLRDDFRSHWLTGEARLELPLGTHHLTLGGQVQDLLQIKQRSFEDGGADYFSNDTKEVVASAYVVDDWAPSPRFRTNLGVRADDYGRSFGLTVNPRLAVIAQPYAGGNTKLLLGRAFRAPTVYERFYNDMGATQIAPIEELNPETMLSAEIEHTHTVTDELQIVAAAFAEQLDNMVILQPTASNADVFVFANQTDPVRGYGAEGELRWEPAADAFFAFALSWNHTRLYTTDGPQPLPNTPTHVASLRFVYPLAGARARVGTEMVMDIGRPTIDPTMNGGVAGDAFTWNLTLSGNTHVGARLRLRYFAGVFNVLDDRTGYPVGAEVLSGNTVARLPRTARIGLAGSF